MNPDIVMDLSHTPGVNYALSYWLGCMLYIAVMPQRSMTRSMRWAIRFIGAAALTSFMMLTDGIDKRFFVPCMLTDAAIMLWLLYASCDCPLRKLVYFTCRAFMLGEFAANMEWQVYYFFSRNGFVQYTPMQSVVFLVLAYAAVFGVMYLLERSYRNGNDLMTVTTREMLMVITVTASIYTVSNLSFVYTNTPFSGSSTSEIFVIRSLVDLGGVGILFAMHMQQHHFTINVEYDYLQKLLAMQYDNYRISEESVRLVNQKYHDLKHQIALLRSEISGESKLAYLDQMEQDIRSYEAQNKTGNDVLDTVLTAKSLQCQREGIGLTVTADGSAISFMQPMDISILFGNALDNAIESVGKLSDREKRLIHLTINRQKRFVRIHMENCYEGELKFVNGMPITNKQDTNFHGFGIKSIRSIVDKYDGSMTIHAENGWFELRILFAEPAQQD